MFREMAKSHPSLERGMVWCKKCGNKLKVDSADCLRSGWPKCCGYTMTIDHPSTWEKTNRSSYCGKGGEMSKKVNPIVSGVAVTCALTALFYTMEVGQGSGSGSGSFFLALFIGCVCAIFITSGDEIFYEED